VSFSDQKQVIEIIKQSPFYQEMNFSISTCLLVMPICLILLGQTMDAAHIKDNHLESAQSGLIEGIPEEVSTL